jgi:hypothetical protein
MELNITNIEINDVDNGINLVFIGDGFTSAQQQLYHDKITYAVQSFFEFVPFNEYRNKFNIYSIPTISNQSGISYKTHPNNPITEVIKDTFLGAYFNHDGMIRLTSYDKKQELELELTRRFKNRVFLILISNAPTYGGSGQFPDDEFMTTTQITMETQYNTFKEIMMHEFGHSFCGLADEYGGNCTSDKPLDYRLPLYDRPNVTNDIVNNRKWDDIVDNPQYFEGANYCNTSWWRSSNVSLMRGWFVANTLLDQQFNEVSIYHIKKRINDEHRMNKRTITFIDDDYVNTRMNSVHRKLLKGRKDIRINSDVVIDSNRIICGNLYINKGCSLEIKSGSIIVYKRLINNGTLINNGKMIKTKR